MVQDAKRRRNFTFFFALFHDYVVCAAGSLSLGSSCRVTCQPEVIAGQKSASGKSRFAELQLFSHLLEPRFRPVLQFAECGAKSAEAGGSVKPAQGSPSDTQLRVPRSYLNSHSAECDRSVLSTRHFSILIDSEIPS
jgi:hypothetical protein